MIIIKPSFEILTEIDGNKILKAIERAGRICYKSEEKITETSAQKFVQGIIKSGHESVIEHQSISVRIVCDRGISHELVRHRLASYSQESTRYCNYGNAGEVTFIEPFFWEKNTKKYNAWLFSCSEAEESYLYLLKLGATPQEARYVLPNSLKTELVMTANLREWRHFFKLRTAIAAHPQMREITIPLLAEFKILIPVIFDDIIIQEKK